jgi:hypothetical protein
MNWIPVYRAAIWLLPSEFRSQFGSQLEADFEQGLAEGRPTLGFLASALWDVLKRGLAERISTVRSGSVAVLLSCLATGLVIGNADSQAAEPQGTVIVLMLAAGLIGAIWRRQALPFVVALALGVPVMDSVIAMERGRGLSGPGFFALVPALIGLAAGIAVGKGLDACEEGVGALWVALVFGFLFAFCRLVLAQPIVLGGCCLFAGVGLGRAAPVRALHASLVLVLGAILAEAIGNGTARHQGFESHLLDLSLALLAVPGAVLGGRFGLREEAEPFPRLG